MAKITAILNSANPGQPADSTTPDVDLTYKVYNSTDGYLVAELFGSATSDSRVSVNSGIVEIEDITEPSGVDGYKISSVNSGGKEAPISLVFVVDANEELQFTLASGLLKIGVGTYENQSSVRWTNAYGVTVSSLGTGETVFEMDINNKSEQGEAMIGWSKHGQNTVFNDGSNDWDWAAYIRASDDSIQARTSVSEGGSGSWTPTGATALWGAGDKLKLVRFAGGGIKLFYNDTQVYGFDNTASNLGLPLYGHIGAGANDATYDGIVSNPNHYDNTPNFKTVFDGPQAQSGVSSANFIQRNGILKFEINSPKMPVTNSNNLVALGTLRFGYYNGFLIIGTGSGFDQYPIAGLEGTDLVLTYDNDVAPFDTTVTSNGTPITKTSTAGTKIRCGTTGPINIASSPADTDDMEFEYLRYYEDNNIIADYPMDEGTGVVINDIEGGKDININVGTGSISTVWVSI